jgi:hypothetical protein
MGSLNTKDIDCPTLIEIERCGLGILPPEYEAVFIRHFRTCRIFPTILDNRNQTTVFLRIG